jgi:GDP-4-dehydro-6-deoxy-D-mannose reductase
MKVLITGVTGSGGSYLAEYILNQANATGGIKVIGTTRDHTAARNIEHVKSRIDLKYLDLNDSLSVYRLFDEMRPDIVFHIASMANVRKSFDYPHEVVTNNINITLNLLEAVRLLKIKDGYNPVIQICSTSEVYGTVDPKNVPITEDCPLKPINPYAVSKMAQDNLGYVYFLNYGMKIIRTRMFTYLNARRADLFATAFGKQILEIKRGERETLVHGNLDTVRTFIDVREAAEAYWVATQKCKMGEVYNIGGSVGISIREFLEMLIYKMGVPVFTEEDPKLLRPSDITVQIPDMSKFTRDTGWKPCIPFNKSVDFFIEELYKFWDKK